MVVTVDGEQITLEAALNKTAPQNLVLRLYSNNVTPANADVVGGYTEVSGNGYASLTLTGASWTYTAPRAGADGVTAGTTTFVSATASFVSGDVGRLIYIASTQPVWAVIVSVTNGTTVVLDTAIATQVTLAWRIASLTSYAQQTFAFTGAGGNVYGYYLTQVTSGKLFAAERFTGAPYVINNNGDEIRVTPKLSLD